MIRSELPGRAHRDRFEQIMRRQAGALLLIAQSEGDAPTPIQTGNVTPAGRRTIMAAFARPGCVEPCRARFRFAGSAGFDARPGAAIMARCPRARWRRFASSAKRTRASSRRSATIRPRGTTSWVRWSGGSSLIPHDFWTACTRIAGGSSPRRLDRSTAVERHFCAWSSPGSR